MTCLKDFFCKINSLDNKLEFQSFKAEFCAFLNQYTARNPEIILASVNYISEHFENSQFIPTSSRVIQALNDFLLKEDWQMTLFDKFFTPYHLQQVLMVLPEPFFSATIKTEILAQFNFPLSLELITDLTQQTLEMETDYALIYQKIERACFSFNKNAELNRMSNFFMRHVKHVFSERFQIYSQELPLVSELVGNCEEYLRILVQDIARAENYNYKKIQKILYADKPSLIKQTAQLTEKVKIAADKFHRVKLLHSILTNTQSELNPKVRLKCFYEQVEIEFKTEMFSRHRDNRLVKLLRKLLAYLGVKTVTRGQQFLANIKNKQPTPIWHRLENDAIPLHRLN